MKITIIGAGIGGLTTAIALRLKGFEIEIFESASQFKKAGSGINLAVNAMQVYKKLGLYNVILEAGSVTNTMNITDNNLNVLSAIDLKNFEDKFNVKSIAIHRATLHQILLEQLTDVTIHLNKKVLSIRQLETEVVLDFEDGTKHKTGLLIGADGIHSVIRNAISKEATIRKAKQVCWRGITNMELPEKFQTELNEAWGKNKRFGFVAIGENEYYWYALASYKENYQDEFRTIDLVQFYADFHPLVGELIQATPKGNLLTNEILDLKPISTWYKNKICLIGDAAHATTPNLGQGACQAIEDAHVIATCLEINPSPNAFMEFQKLRMAKAHMVVNQSWITGKISHLSQPILILLRNSLLRLIPAKINQLQLVKMFRLQNPA